MQLRGRVERLEKLLSEPDTAPVYFCVDESDRIITLHGEPSPFDGQTVDEALDQMAARGRLPIIVYTVGLESG